MGHQLEGKFVFIDPALTEKIVRVYLIDGSFPQSIKFISHIKGVKVFFSTLVLDYIEKVLNSQKEKAGVDLFLKRFGQLKSDISEELSLSLSANFRHSIRFLEALRINSIDLLSRVHFCLARYHNSDFYLTIKQKVKQINQGYNKFIQENKNVSKNDLKDEIKCLKVFSLQQLFEKFVTFQLKDMASLSKEKDFYFVNPGKIVTLLTNILPTFTPTRLYGIDGLNSIVQGKELLKNLDLMGKNLEKSVFRKRIKKTSTSSFYNTCSKHSRDVNYIEWINIPEIDDIQSILNNVTEEEEKVVLLDVTAIMYLFNNYKQNHQTFGTLFEQLTLKGFRFGCLPGLLIELEQTGNYDYLKFLLTKVLHLPTLLKILHYIHSLRHVFSKIISHEINPIQLSDHNYIDICLKLHARVAQLIGAQYLLTSKELKKAFHLKEGIRIETFKKFLNTYHKISKELIDTVPGQLLEFDLFKEELPSVIRSQISINRKNLLYNVRLFWDKLSDKQGKPYNSIKVIKLLSNITSRFSQLESNLRAKTLINSDKLRESQHLNCLLSIRDYKHGLKQLFSELYRINNSVSILSVSRFIELITRFNYLLKELKQSYGTSLQIEKISSKIPISSETSFGKTLIFRSIFKIPKVQSNGNIIITGSETLENALKLEKAFEKFLLIRYQFHESELSSIYKEFMNFLKKNESVRLFKPKETYEQFKVFFINISGTLLINLEKYGIYYSALLEQLIILSEAYHNDNGKDLSLEKASVYLQVSESDLELLMKSVILNRNYYKKHNSKLGIFSLFFHSIKEGDPPLTKNQEQNRSLVYKKTFEKKFVPYWVIDNRTAIDRCNPDLWIETLSHTHNDSIIYYLGKEGGIMYPNRLFDIEMKGRSFATFVDTGAFKSLISKSIADKLFPSLKRVKLLISGYTQHAKWVELIENVEFQFNGFRFKDDFIIDGNLESLFKSEVVLGIDAYNQLLARHYGKTMKTLFSNDNSHFYESFEEKQKRVGKFVDLQEKRISAEVYLTKEAKNNRYIINNSKFHELIITLMFQLRLSSPEKNISEEEFKSAIREKCLGLGLNSKLAPSSSINKVLDDLDINPFLHLIEDVFYQFSSNIERSALEMKTRLKLPFDLKTIAHLRGVLFCIMSRNNRALLSRRDSHFSKQDTFISPIEDLSSNGTGAIPYLPHELEQSLDILISDRDLEKNMFVITETNIQAEQEAELEYLTLTEKIQIKGTPEISQLCHNAKNLYNFGNFICRKLFFIKYKNPNCSWDDFLTIRQSIMPDPSIKDYVQKRGVLLKAFNELKNGIKFKNGKQIKESLCTLLKYCKYNNLGYKIISQQILRVLGSNWSIYFTNNKNFNKGELGNRPSIPRYLDSNGEYILIYPGQLIRSQVNFLPHIEQTNRTSKYKNFGKTTAELLIPNRHRNVFPPIRVRYDVLKNLSEVRVIPRGTYYEIEIRYYKTVENYGLNRNNAASIDLGLRNPLAIANNLGLQPILLQGREYKQANYFVNKVSPYYRSIQGVYRDILKKSRKSNKTILQIIHEKAQKYFKAYQWKEKIANFVLNNPTMTYDQFKVLHGKNKKLKNLFNYLKEFLDVDSIKGYLFYEKRELNRKQSICNDLKNDLKGRFEHFQRVKDLEFQNQLILDRLFKTYRNKTRDATHKLSRCVIDYCRQHDIGTIVIGYNEGWKTSSKLSKAINRRFISIPFYKLIESIKYKAVLCGIMVIVQEESYTSKCSALDKESLEFHLKYAGVRNPSIQGKNGVVHKHYGQFYSIKSKRYIHSDINGAFNIGRKGAPSLFDRIPQSWMLIPPKRIAVT